MYDHLKQLARIDMDARHDYARELRRRGDDVRSELVELSTETDMWDFWTLQSTLGYDRETLGEYEDVSPFFDHVQTLDSDGDEDVNLCFLGLFKQLRTLNLSGTANVWNLEALKSLHHLEALVLGNMEETDFEIDHIAHMVQLKYLSLARHHLDDINPLTRMTQLKVLNLSACNISSLTWMESLTGLQELDLSCNDIENISPLSKLKNLEIINLSETHVQDLLPRHVSS